MRQGMNSLSDCRTYKRYRYSYLLNGKPVDYANLIAITKSGLH